MPYMTDLPGSDIVFTDIFYMNKSHVLPPQRIIKLTKTLSAFSESPISLKWEYTLDHEIRGLEISVLPSKGIFGFLGYLTKPHFCELWNMSHDQCELHARILKVHYLRGLLCVAACTAYNALSFGARSCFLKGRKAGRK